MVSEVREYKEVIYVGVFEKYYEFYFVDNRFWSNDFFYVQGFHLSDEACRS